MEMVINFFGNNLQYSYCEVIIERGGRGRERRPFPRLFSDLKLDLPLLKCIFLSISHEKEARVGGCNLYSS